MKKTLIYLFALLPIIAVAQVDRSKAPQPAKAPEIKIGQPATFTLTNGLKVFVVQNNKLPRVSASLSIDMDGIIEGEKSGLTSMAGSLLRRGTTKMNKAKLDEEIDFLGASINTSATGVSAFSLKENFPKIMALMGDIVLRPSLPADELEKIRKQQLSALQSAKDNPDAIAQNVVNRLTYGANHPYGDIITEQTVNNVKLEDIKAYFDTWWKPNNAYLVFVGDITTTEAKTLAEKALGTWQRGTVPKPTYKQPAPPAKTYIAVVDRPASVQSNITFSVPVALKPGAQDAIPGSVMNNILGGGFSGRLFANLREKRGFTYGAYSSLNPNRLVGTFEASASIRNEKTDSAIGEFLSEFNRIRTEALPQDEVVRMKNYLSGSFARSLESPSTIAAFALDIARNNLPANYYQDYLKNLASVTPQTVQQMAQKFVLPGQMHIVIVGNAKEIAPGLEKYGEVKYFDVYGNETAAPATKTVDASVTPQSILQKAANATATAQTMAAIKDLQLSGDATIMNQKIAVTQKHIFPNTFSTVVSMGGTEIQKEMLKDGTYSQVAQGRSIDLDAKGKEEIDQKAAFFSDAYLLNQKGNDYKMLGIEKVEGKDAYGLQVKTATGRTYTNYYDVASGLKVKSVSTQETPMGELSIQSYLFDYKPYNGVQIPTRIVVDFGQMKQELKFTDVKVNTGLKKEDIK